ncbi:MAG: L-histidine N(alpha)-methyltransferase [Polyangiales bacterium]
MPRTSPTSSTTTGSALYERITDLPEYYPTRTERAILAANADEIVAGVGSRDEPPEVLELGAGSATKTTLILAAALRRWGRRCTYRPLDLAPR